MNNHKVFALFIKAFGFVLLFFVSSFASEPVVWTLNSRAEILKGDARGVSITDTGAILLAPKLMQVFDTAQAFIWSGAGDNKGNIFLGTGHDGRIYKVGADGKGALFYDSAELDVTALAVGKDGFLYAGTSPDGKVYRIGADGKAETYFDPSDKYIWSLAIMNDGSLAVGTGDNGKIYRVKTIGAKAEDSVFYNTNETHVISMVVDAQGNLIVGTDSNGLVLRISANGKAFALFDAPLREIHAIALAADGSIYVLALSDAAAGGARPTGTSTSSSTEGGVTTTITVGAIDDSSPSTIPKSRNDVSTAKSVVYRILPDGGVDVVWNSSSVVGFSIAAQDNRVLIGTSDKGRIYSVTNDGRDTLLLQSTEGQISNLIARGKDVFATSSNQGKLFRFGSETNVEGTFESPVRDTRLSAAWGKIWWRGVGSTTLQTRTGNTERPDQTWSDWSAAYTDANGTQVTSPRARYIQWRSVLKTGASETKLEDVSLAYLPRNIAPEVLAIQTFPIGVGLQEGNPVPKDPNIESSGLDPALFGAGGQIPPRKIYQRGALSLQWNAEDRNNDKLEYAIYYRGLNEKDFRLLKNEIHDNFYTIDGAALADGRYVFKIVASDAPGNPLGQELKGEKTSEPVDIDNTPPLLKTFGEPQINGDKVRIVIEAEDATGKIDRADVSINSSDWKSVTPEDSIADSAKERYILDLQITGSGEHVVSLRVYDKNGNVGSIRVTVKKG
jgi:sugar lactone lactonase YvrE